MSFRVGDTVRLKSSAYTEVTRGEIVDQWERHYTTGIIQVYTVCIRDECGYGDMIDVFETELEIDYIQSAVQRWLNK